MRLHAAAPLVLLDACRTDADESLAHSCANISGACSCDLGGGAALHWDCAAAPPAVVAELAWAGGRDAVLVDERCGFEAELAPWLARRAGVFIDALFFRPKRSLALGIWLMAGMQRRASAA